MKRRILFLISYLGKSKTFQVFVILSWEKLSDISTTYCRDMNSIQSNGFSALYLLSHPKVTYRKQDKSMGSMEKLIHVSKCRKHEGKFLLPEDGLQQTVCTDSWGLSSFRSDHMEGPCRQTLSQFPQLREQSDKLYPTEAASAANCTKYAKE